MGNQKRDEGDADLALAGSGVEEVWHPARPQPAVFDEAMTPLEKVGKGLDEMYKTVNKLVDLCIMRGDAITVQLLQKYSSLSAAVMRYAREAAGEEG